MEPAISYHLHNFNVFSEERILIDRQINETKEILKQIRQQVTNEMKRLKQKTIGRSKF